MTILFQITFFL